MKNLFVNATITLRGKGLGKIIVARDLVYTTLSHTHSTPTQHLEFPSNHIECEYTRNASILYVCTSTVADSEDGSPDRDGGELSDLTKKLLREKIEKEGKEFMAMQAAVPSPSERQLSDSPRRKLFSAEETTAKLYDLAQIANAVYVLDEPDHSETALNKRTGDYKVIMASIVQVL
jgi:hypothetical protein